MIQSVMIDQREPEHVKNIRFGGVPVAVTMLPAGDIWVATDDARMLCVERKTPDDFLNSLRGDRIFGQCAALREHTPWAYLIITGLFLRSADNHVVTGRVTGWDYNAVQGALLTIQELGVGVIHITSEHDLEGAILRLANRKRDVVRVPPARHAHVLSDAEAVIAALPGIGPERLDEINRIWPLNEMAYMALLALTDPDPAAWDIPGIGAGISRRIRRVLGLPDGVYLTTNSKENKNNEQRIDIEQAA